MNRTYRTVPPARAAAWVFLSLGLTLAGIDSPTRADLVVREVIASAEPCLGLHPEPDSTSTPVRCLPPGERMNLLQSREGWALVRLDDNLEGWVTFARVRPVGDAFGSRSRVELETRLATARAEREELRRGTSTLRKDLYELRLANDRLVASAAARARAEANAETRIAELETALADAMSQRELRSGETLERETRIAALEAEVLEGLRRESELMDRLADSERATAALESELTELRQDRSRLEAEASARATADAAALRRAESLEEALASVEAERVRLEENETALRQEADRLRAEAERLAAAVARQASQGQLAATQERFPSLEQALAQTESERLALENAASELRVQVEQLRSENSRLAAAATVPEPSPAPAPVQPRPQLAVFEAALGATEAERLALEQTVAALETQVAAGRSRLEDLAARLAAAEMFLTVSEEQRVENGRQIEGLRAELEGREAPGATPRVDLEGSRGGEFSGATESTGSSDPDSDVGETVPAPTLEGSRPASSPAPAEATVSAGEWTAVVEAWAKAWSEQRVADYLYFYSSDFEPQHGMSRSEWEAQRRERIVGPERIEVRVALADLRPLDEERVEVVFLQSYESDRLTDVVVKTLELVNEDGLWKIAAERVE